MTQPTTPLLAPGDYHHAAALLRQPQAPLPSVVEGLERVRQGLEAPAVALGQGERSSRPLAPTHLPAAAAYPTSDPRETIASAAFQRAGKIARTVEFDAARLRKTEAQTAEAAQLLSGVLGHHPEGGQL